jgi:hypothetical protein
MAPPSGTITASTESKGNGIANGEGVLKASTEGELQNGKPNANSQQSQPLPTMDEIRAAVPKECFERVIKF